MILSPVLRQRYLDSNGNPLAGGKLYSYTAGTVTPLATYSNATGTANTNPIILDANGEANLWLDPSQSYKFVLKDSSDVTQWTVDQAALGAVFTGDTGLGGTIGSVPAPAAGDAAAGKFLKASGAWAVPAASVSTATAPNVQSFTATGTTTGYVFTVGTANATVGATYTNNGHTYTVLSTITSGVDIDLPCSQASAPQASGTLTKASGTGDATISFSAVKALATYTTPTSPSPLYLKVRMVGGGGGGGGSGTSAGSTGSQGTASYFGAGLLKAAQGSGGSSGGQGTIGVGGSSVGSATGFFRRGSGGAAGRVDATGTTGNTNFGASGASTVFGYGGWSAGTTGLAAAANSGGGGSGAGITAAGAATTSGAGGGSGGYVEAWIYSPTSTYIYAVGTGGAGGALGTGGSVGGAGADGYIEVIAHYQ